MIVDLNHLHSNFTLWRFCFSEFTGTQSEENGFEKSFRDSVIESQIKRRKQRKKPKDIQ